MSLGVVLLGGGGALLGLAIKDKNTISSNNEKLTAFYTPEMPLDPELKADLEAENADLTSRRTKFLYGAYFGVIIGLVAIAYSFVPLTKSIRSKRQLDGLALGPTRLQWNGGAGVRLRF